MTNHPVSIFSSALRSGGASHSKKKKEKWIFTILVATIRCLCTLQWSDQLRDRFFDPQTPWSGLFDLGVNFPSLLPLKDLGAGETSLFDWVWQSAESTTITRVISLPKSPYVRYLPPPIFSSCYGLKRRAATAPTPSSPTDEASVETLESLAAARRKSRDAPSDPSTSSNNNLPDSPSHPSPLEKPSSLDETAEEASQEAAFNEETGEINWDCPCLGGMAHGPCGEEFRASFSCFVFSKEDPKGMDCIEHFKYVLSLFFFEPHWIPFEHPRWGYVQQKCIRKLSVY